MTTRQRCFVMLASLAIGVAACGGPSRFPLSPSTTVGESASGSRPPASEPTASPSPSPSPEPLRIGLVTAVPNAEGVARDALMAQAVSTAAGDLGAVNELIETEEESDYAPNIQAFVEHGFGIVVTVGEGAGPATIAVARGASDTWFIGVDQHACLTLDGEPDPSGACEGDPAVLVPNYQAIAFADDQSGYLAGIIAASVSDRPVLGVVGGSSVPWVVRSWRAFENGARSVDPDTDVRYVELAADASGFGDPAVGRARADELITAGAGVLFQVAGDAGRGVLEGACAAGIHSIGSIADQAAALPDLGCIVTSAERHYREVVAAAIEQAASGGLVPGAVVSGLGADPPGVTLAPLTGGVALSADAQSILEAATRALAAGTLDPCAPIQCTVSGA